MNKVTGIKSVDCKITALGHGLVNWNGPTTLTGDSRKTVDNHSLPKLRSPPCAPNLVTQSINSPIF